MWIFKVHTHRFSGGWPQKTADSKGLVLSAFHSDLPRLHHARSALIVFHARHLPGAARASDYRGTSRIRNSTPLGPYRRPMPRTLGGS